MAIDEVININILNTINYNAIKKLVSACEDSDDNQLYILEDGSVVILNQARVPNRPPVYAKLNLSNGDKKRWGAKAAEDATWIIMIHDELRRCKPNRRRSVFED